MNFFKKVNMKTNKILMLSLAIGLSLSACKKDDDDVTQPSKTNSEEVITTMQLIFTDSENPAQVKTFVYRDVDGLGGNEPSIDTIKLGVDKTYSVQIVLLDETKNPVDTVSKEVKKESDEHLFVFEPANSEISVTINDFDVNTPPLPLGLLSTWSTGTSMLNTSIKISLKHQPGIKNGDPTRGESDIEVVMPVISR